MDRAVMFDEAHHNFHTSDGRYKPFVDLLLNDGYKRHSAIDNRFVQTRLSGSRFSSSPTRSGPKRTTIRAPTTQRSRRKRLPPLLIG
jgi:hypothetical protein